MRFKGARPKALDTGPLTVGNVTYHFDGRPIIRLPERLDFDTAFESTAAHLSLIVQALKKGIRIRSLDFSALRYISPSAALVLVSAVDLWNQKTRGKLRAAHTTWHPSIKALLCQMGYFELLGIERPPFNGGDLKTTFLQFKSGHTGASSSGAQAKQLRVEHEHLVGRKIKKQFLFEGLSEAITNAGQHAYKLRKSNAPEIWWLSGSYDSTERILTVMFYDRGDGIPKTLPKSKLFEKIRDAFDGWRDSQKIEAAMEIGRTATGKQERGKGLQNFIEFARIHSQGKLAIYSLHGLHRMVWEDARQSERPTYTFTHDFKHSICGTLIEWTVKI